MHNIPNSPPPPYDPSWQPNFGLTTGSDVTEEEVELQPCRQELTGPFPTELETCQGDIQEEHIERMTYLAFLPKVSW